MTRTEPVLAVDLGGTTIKAALVTGDGEVHDARAVRTPFEDGPDAVVEALCSLVLDRLEVSRRAGRSAVSVGVVVPGVVDADAGIARYAANIGWHDYPLRRVLTEATGVPVALGHDVHAAGLAELRLGAARDVADALIVVLGTGIAGVVVADGRPVSGSSGLSGEIGHIPVGDLGTQCRCGAFGCMELFSSARGVSRLYRERTGRWIDAERVVAGLGRDADAEAVWSVATRTLARGLVCAGLVTDPARIILSGGLSGAGTALLDPTARALAAGMPWRPPPALTVSPLGSRAGLLGAALLAAQPTGAAR